MEGALCIRQVHRRSRSHVVCDCIKHSSYTSQDENYQLRSLPSELVSKQSIFDAEYGWNAMYTCAASCKSYGPYGSELILLILSRMQCYIPTYFITSSVRLHFPCSSKCAGLILIRFHNNKKKNKTYYYKLIST